MNKKIFVLLSLLLIASMLLAACTPGATAQPTPGTAPTSAAPAPTAAAPVFMTINTEQVSTWVRNFNPFSPDARGATGTAIYEPMMIYNKATAKIVPWLVRLLG